MKKVFYSAAIAAVCIGLTACGGKKSEEQAVPAAAPTEDSEYYDIYDDEDDADSYAEEDEEDADAEYLDEVESDDSAESDSDEDTTESTGGSGAYFDASELSAFIADGKSGDIDRMIKAAEWQNKVEAELKPAVRALDEDAIRAKIKVDKAITEIGNKYDSYSLFGALSSRTDDMTDSQLSRYNAAYDNKVMFFTVKDDTAEYNSLYRRLRYGI